MKEKIIDFINQYNVRDFLNENKIMLLKVAVAMILVTVAFFIYSREDEEVLDEPDIVKEEKATLIMVDICGEVNNPTVVELSEGARVEDAIAAAGGITDKADISEINRAAFLNDGDKIIIPTLISEIQEGEKVDTSFASVVDDRININTADSIELQQLAGIGPVTAEKIISYRESNGRFKTVDEIMNVQGIGAKTFEKFKDNIRT